MKKPQKRSSGLFLFVGSAASAFLDLRPEDSITVTGKITGWETVFGTNARLEDCQISETRSP